jgi:hypothetical protein
MWSLTRAARRVGVVVACVGALAGFQGVGVAAAAPGTVLANLTPPGVVGGSSVAFDGQYLYYTDAVGTMLHRITPGGVAGTDVPIVGGAPINALTYDASHDIFWGVDATGLNVYQIQKNGLAALQFTILPLLDLPGSCNLLAGCSSTVSGLAYDATTDSLWYLPQSSQRVYHFNTAGQLLGYFDTANVPACADNAVTGIAAGASVVYLTAGSCTNAFQYAKSDSGTGTTLSSFPVGGIQSAGAACDSITFPGTTALWVRDAGTGQLQAVEIPAGTCVSGGGVAPDSSSRWMSGAGRGLGTEAVVLTSGGQPYTEGNLDVQHAFHLLCDQGGGPPNNLVVNWKDSIGNHFSFHLEQWTPGSCFYDLTKPASPPPCDPIVNPSCFNTMTGSGIGRLTGRGPHGELLPIGGTCNPRTGDTAHCGTLDPFRVTDRGEPNTNDSGAFGINDPVQGEILDVCACTRANYQAHQRPR